jgi:hypothetical protein
MKPKLILCLALLVQGAIGTGIASADSGNMKELQWGKPVAGLQMAAIAELPADAFYCWIRNAESHAITYNGYCLNEGNLGIEVHDPSGSWSRLVLLYPDYYPAEGVGPTERDKAVLLSHQIIVDKGIRLPDEFIRSTDVPASEKLGATLKVYVAPYVWPQTVLKQAQIEVRLSLSLADSGINAPSAGPNTGYEPKITIYSPVFHLDGATMRSLLERERQKGKVTSSLEQPFIEQQLSAPANHSTDWISDLRSPDMAVRWAAINTIQTMDDPRIPAICLPLLQDEGDSIRRQAARAIGSRFAQISSNDRDRYVQALQTCAASGSDDVTLMCQRAIGLLTRNYAFPSFSVSPNGKWVLYERRRLPVVANIRSQSHILLSPCLPPRPPENGPEYSRPTDQGDNILLKMKVTNEPASDLFDPHWQPSGDAVAFGIETLQARFYRPICVWSAPDPDVRVLDVQFFQSLLGSRYPQWGTTTDFMAWKGDKVLIRVYNCAYPEGGHPPDPGLIVSYDIHTKKISLER